MSALRLVELQEEVRQRSRLECIVKKVPPRWSHARVLSLSIGAVIVLSR